MKDKVRKSCSKVRRTGLIFYILFYFFCFLFPCRAEDIRDVKPPVTLPPDWRWLYGVLVLVLATGAYFLIKRFFKREIKKPAPVLPPRPAHVIAYARLEELKNKNFPGQQRIKEYFDELSDIARFYIEDRFCIRAPEMTTEEFLTCLNTSDILKAEHKVVLGDFLNSCDLVKFARHGATEVEIERSFDFVRKFVDETKKEVAAGIV